jgi:hypothetical protein
MGRTVERKRSELARESGGVPDPSLEPVELKLSIKGPELGLTVELRGRRRSVAWLLVKVGGAAGVLVGAIAAAARLLGH